MTDLDLAVIAVLSRIRTCDDCCSACRAQAAELLGEPVDRCGLCGFPVIADALPCRCLEQAEAVDNHKRAIRRDYAAPAA